MKKNLFFGKQSRNAIIKINGMKMRYLKIIFVLQVLLNIVYGRIHTLEIREDARRYVALSTFGFYKDGYLQVNMTNFRPEPFSVDHIFGFSLDKTLTDAMNPYLDSHQDICVLNDPVWKNASTDSIFFTMDLVSKFLKIDCNGPSKNAVITESRPKYYQESSMPLSRMARDVSAVRDTCVDGKLPITIHQTGKDANISLHFVMRVATNAQEGLYSLYFHSCPNYGRERVKMNMVIEIEENNLGNFLSAGEMPLPALYSMMAVLFFLSGCFWVFILKNSRHPVFKIHYLMALLVFLKSLSLLFHGINYHFIEIKGEHIATWAILYYITHLLKGSVLFIVILLVGTGWAFIKHILSEKDRKLFMLVIPLQLLTAVADIILEESEEGDAETHMWRNIFILVDLICCGAILFPVVWSIRHLQEASETDGKAATNLRKLKLFRHFYIMIVCYIYFTRIIVYLLKITMPFQYEWLDEMFREMATYVFYVLTGYKFRPASANPYFQLQTQDDDDELDIVISETGLTEGLKKVNRIETDGKHATEEEREIMLNRRESSHEYD